AGGIEEAGEGVVDDGFAVEADVVQLAAVRELLLPGPDPVVRAAVVEQHVVVAGEVVDRGVAAEDPALAGERLVRKGAAHGAGPVHGRQAAPAGQALALVAAAAAALEDDHPLLLP